MEIIIKTWPEERQRVLDALEDFTRRHAVPASVVKAADLALEEHLTNVVSHGYDASAARDVVIRLTLELDGPWMQLEVEDGGRPFDPLSRLPVDTAVPLEQREIGGLGVHLMRQFMDEIDYRRVTGKNILRMRKRLDKNAK